MCVCVCVFFFLIYSRLYKIPPTMIFIYIKMIWCITIHIRARITFRESPGQLIKTLVPVYPTYTVIWLVPGGFYLVSNVKESSSKTRQWSKLKRKN